jgi:hypothetical protein
MKFYCFWIPDGLRKRIVSLFREDDKIARKYKIQGCRIYIGVREYLIFDDAIGFVR